MRWRPEWVAEYDDEEVKVADCDAELEALSDAEREMVAESLDDFDVENECDGDAEKEIDAECDVECVVDTLAVPVWLPGGVGVRPWVCDGDKVKDSVDV